MPAGRAGTWEPTDPNNTVCKVGTSEFDAQMHVWCKILEGRWKPKTFFMKKTFSLNIKWLLPFWL